MKIELGGNSVLDNRSVETSKSLIGYDGYSPGIGDNLLFDRSKIITASSPPFCRGRLQRRHYQIHCQQPAIFFCEIASFFGPFVICISFVICYLYLLSSRASCS